MEFSYQYTQTMKALAGQPFSWTRTEASINVPMPLILTCNYDPSGCEVPAPLIWGLSTMQMPNNGSTTEIFYPMSVNPSALPRSGVDAILKHFASNCVNSGYRLCKVITPKGETYYGNRGIILDKDFNVLYLSTYSVDSSIVNDLGAIGETRPTIYLHPLVFTDSNGLNKALVKKALPFLLTEPINNYGSKAKVVIDDSSKFIHKVVKPIRTLKGELPSNEDYNEVLKKNIGKLICQFSYNHV